ncbi:hypothetical protein XENTR_v10002296 [Xenopus tropicalis]|nr:hypothetical protein XENTR_v10002296 [Xenopus tropicalis]
MGILTKIAMLQSPPFHYLNTHTYKKAINYQHGLRSVFSPVWMKHSSILSIAVLSLLCKCHVFFSIVEVTSNLLPLYSVLNNKAASSSSSKNPADFLFRFTDLESFMRILLCVKMF